MTDDGGDDVSVRDELRVALAESRQYLLSHHEPSEYHRCHTLQIRGRPVQFCARCSGIYPGIAVGLGLFATGLLASIQLVVVALFPLPALIDWSLTSFRPAKGSNAIRTVTGGLLGIGYGLGLGHLLVDREPLVLALGLGYALLAAVALALYHRSGTNNL